MQQPRPRARAPPADGVRHDARVAEFEQQFFDRFGRRLRLRRGVDRQPPAQGDEEGVRRGVGRGAGDGDVDRRFVEQGLERAERRAVEEQRDDRERVGAAALPLHGERVLQFLADPTGLMGARRDEDENAGRAGYRVADR
ncbi:MAG: hypothetical protein AW06_002622 [Candidatus Accumulibacter cognatus]|uniref:Uncharacterized protein n=1 Tax=Candidatus Accumulibacter cognatus TaxID=2954383 RepID=A0A080M6U3_9PROT|nr:MAG: hypothetical protein AW06_002622 [Candidatus Accumulibacter cognatus]